ncbi:sensor domain-containing diguanylate cyclase [Alkalibacterium olivapovliticus]|uniref:Diguanylate cyclase (GGDEF)-like protein n=1 Tax=Alkalibacterium olivapovliticus TaxID=99907 RepID=A0A2T0W952_9LACT|nr:sensor domain-containing diguanylate cyclase [Alkalibacterium olivapovliticus]PRY83227.1 diguanylate cyclase (GGDEF)-like protein [Alkalibacterium olivapovliticus]
MISTLKKRLIWISYLVFSPLLFYIVYHFSPETPDFMTIEFSIFVVLSIIVALYPIQTEDTILFLINGVSLSTFVLFGLFAELVLTTLALIALMIRSNIKADEHYRYPLNLLMFQLLSVLSAGSYYLLNPYINPLSFYNHSLTLLVIYMFVHLIGNQLGLYVISRYYFRNKEIKLYDSHLKFSIITCLFTVPVSFILIYLVEELSIIGALIGAIPFVTITLGLNFFYKSKMNSTYLKKVNSLAKNLTEKKRRSEVIETYVKSLAQIFPVDALSYFTVSPEEELHRIVVYQETKGIETMKEAFLVNNQSILKQATWAKDILYFSRSSDWKKYCINDITYPAESALVLPVLSNNEVTELILLSHRTKNMYNDMIVSLIKILHQYFAVALDNAVYYEQLELNSETDYLTSLPNLKGFSKKLEEALAGSLESVSLIVMDLDRFKLTNDTYGHQAGNEILKQVARLLESSVISNQLVARYGGEEFVLLLPGYSKKEAGELAEGIRNQIDRHSFTISQSIQNTTSSSVSVTASLGVATYPEDAREADELITTADKAMYIGSKQKGRNRVTIAKKGSYQNAVKETS